MEHQPDLDFGGGKPRKPWNSVLNHDLNELLVILRLHSSNRWLTAVEVVEIQKRNNDAFEGKRFSRDYLRHLVKAADGQIISGQSGYRWTQYVTNEELHVAGSILLNNAQGNMKRRSDLYFVFHNGRTRTQKERASYDKQLTDDGRKSPTAPGQENVSSVIG